MAHFIFRTETADRSKSRFVTAIENAAVRHNHTVDVVDGNGDSEMLLEMLEGERVVVRERSFPRAMQLMLEHRSLTVLPRNIGVSVGQTPAFAFN